MTFALRGVVEGFYGRPWTWAAREAAVDFLTTRGFNAYLYAPKNEWLHRNRWREPYLPEEQARFAAFAARCRAAGIALVFGVSPLRFRYDDDEDLTRLLAKFDAAAAGGIRDFCLLLDDMPGALAGEHVTARFDGLAQAHAWLAAAAERHVTAAGPGRSLWLVPLQYHGDPDTPYLRTLGRLVPETVPICWTGPEVCSPELTLPHTREVAAILRRPVLYWDNHPVNDGDMRHDPHLGPLRGRHARLPEAASGFLANLARQPEASRIAVATVGDYCADPHGYDPEQSWTRALADVSGDPDDADAVAVLAEVACRSPLAPGCEAGGRLARTLARQRASGGDRRALEATHAEARRLAAAADRLSALTNPRLRSDLRPWTAKLAHWAAVLGTAVEMLLRTLDDPDAPGVTAQRRALADRLADPGPTSHRVGDDLLDQLVRACLWQAPAPQPAA